MLQHAVFFLIVGFRQIGKQTRSGFKFDGHEICAVRAGRERFCDPRARVVIIVMDGRAQGLILEGKKRCLAGGGTLYAAGLDAAFVEASVLAAREGQILLVRGRLHDRNFAHGGGNAARRDVRLRKSGRLVLLCGRGGPSLRRILRRVGGDELSVAAGHQDEQQQKYSGNGACNIELFLGQMHTKATS